MEGDKDYDAIAAYASISIVIAYFVMFLLDYKEKIPIAPFEDKEHSRGTHMCCIFYGSGTTCISYLRMAPYPFFNLAKIMRDRRLLKDTLYVSVEEQLAMFLHIVGHNTKNRVVGIESIRSGETVSRYFNQVLGAIRNIWDIFMRQPGYDVPEEITSGSTYYPWFKDCMGLIDGTHIEATVLAEIAGRFIGRKEGTTQNVLCAALPNKQFTYVMAGWEGSANDFTVLKDALSIDPPLGLRVLTGKYYLVDAGYTTMPGFIAPYRGTRYHLKEQYGHTPNNHRELFNLRHSSLRSKIESAFGMLKNRFKILAEHPFFPFNTQVDIVLACCILHNYILQTDPDDYFCNQVSECEEVTGETFNDVQLYFQNRPQREIREENRVWVEKRDNMALAMWQNYCDTYKNGVYTET